MVDNSRTILILNIKIDGTRNEDLVVKENDEPEEIALEFCNKHNLPIYLKDVLIKNIEENLDVFIEEEVGENTKFLSSTNSKITNAESEHRRTGSAKNYGEVLYDKGIMLKQKVEYMVQVQKQSLLEKEMRNMTFKPKINPYTLKPRGISEGCARKLSQKRIEEQTICTFKPTINKYRGKSKENTKKTDKCVELYQSAARIKQKREEKGRKIFNETYTFKPKVLKTNVCMTPKASSKQFQPQYIQRIKEQQTRLWFNLLNPNSNGCINKSTVLGVTLQKSIYEKIGRIVEELIELDEELNFEEFCKAVEIVEKEVNGKSTAIDDFENSIE